MKDSKTLVMKFITDYGNECYEKGKADRENEILEKQTIIYDLNGMGYRVVLVEDIL